MSSSSSRKSANQHKRAAARARAGSYRHVITVKRFERTPETDTNAHYLREAIAAAGHTVTAYRLIRDEKPVRTSTAVLEELAATTASQILLWNGGTGISPRDTTYDALSKKTRKDLARVWRDLSNAQLSGNWRSGLCYPVRRRECTKVWVVISTPGSPSAVKLAWEKLDPARDSPPGLGSQPDSSALAQASSLFRLGSKLSIH